MLIVALHRYFFGTGELLRVFGCVMYIHTYDSYCKNSTNSLSVQLFSPTPFSPSPFAPTNSRRRRRGREC
jgi:hypothetical protein